MARLKYTRSGKTKAPIINQMNAERRDVNIMSGRTIDIHIVRTDEVLEVGFPNVLRRFLGNRRGRRMDKTFRCT